MYSVKNKVDKEFYEYKWFKLICLFFFFGWLFYIGYKPFKINTDDLIELNATVKEDSESGGSRNPIKLYFETKEYSCRFGIYVGGIFGRWEEVKNALKKNSLIKIKIYKNNEKNLNIKKDVIPIYYLNNNEIGLVFNENEFNQGEKSSNNRFIGLIIILFLFSLWGIIRE